MFCVIVFFSEVLVRVVLLSRCTLRLFRWSLFLFIYYCFWRLDFSLFCGLKSKVSGKMCRKYFVVRGRIIGRFRRCFYCFFEVEERFKYCWGVLGFYIVLVSLSDI